MSSIRIAIPEQALELFDDSGALLRRYLVSTSSRGAGERFIYIHGSPDTAVMGKPGSIGCVRMHNRDLVELFDLVSAGTPVNLTG